MFGPCGTHLFVARKFAGHGGGSTGIAVSRPPGDVSVDLRVLQAAPPKYNRTSSYGHEREPVGRVFLRSLLILPRIFVVGVKLLPASHVVLLILQILLAHGVFVPLMSSDATAHCAEDAVTGHVTSQGAGGCARQTADSLYGGTGDRKAQNCCDGEECEAHFELILALTV